MHDFAYLALGLAIFALMARYARWAVSSTDRA